MTKLSMKLNFTPLHDNILDGRQWALGEGR
jgi:hypothetical protein